MLTTPLQFPSENGTGYYLSENNLNDPSPGIESNFLPEIQRQSAFLLRAGRTFQLRSLKLMSS